MNRPLNYLNIFKKNVIIAGLKKSINKLPTNGIIKNAVGEGPYFSVTDVIFAIPFGVAPNPNPQCPAVKIAAS